MLNDTFISIETGEKKNDEMIYSFKTYLTKVISEIPELLGLPVKVVTPLLAELFFCL